MVDDVALRALVPQVLSVLVRRGADFATAEDAVQEALVRALVAWEREEPADPKGWLITAAWRAFLDVARSEAARRDREVRSDTEPEAGTVPGADDTLDEGRLRYWARTGRTGRGALTLGHNEPKANTSLMGIRAGSAAAPARQCRLGRSEITF